MLIIKNGRSDLNWWKAYLYGTDEGYRYRVLPVGGKGEFVNPDDGASLVFDTKVKSAITMVLSGRVKFRKI